MSQYRVNHKIHIGAASTYLEKGEVISYSGTAIVRANGDSLDLPNSFLAGAIKQGWIVPAEAAEVQFRPKPAGIEIREAVASGTTRELVSSEGLKTTAEEATVSRAIEKKSEAAPASRDDGRVVARLKPLSSQKVEIGKDDRKVVQELDNKSRVEVEPVKKVATGDVETALSGDDLTEILPDAASSDKPPAGVYRERAETATGSTTVGGAEDGVVVARVGVGATTAMPESAEEQRALLMKWAVGEAPEVSSALAQSLARKVFENLQAAPVDPTGTDEAADLQGQDSDFVWNLDRHWKTRQKEVLHNYMDNPDALLTISKIENSKGVLKVVEARLKELGV